MNCSTTVLPRLPAAALVLAAHFISGAAFAQVGGAAESRVGRPIIDMHLHAVALDMTLPVAMPNPVTGEPAPASGLEQMQEAMELMERYNIVRAVVSGSVEAVAAWREAAPERVIGSLDMGRPGFTSGGEPLPEIDRLKALYADETLAAMGEVTANVSCSARIRWRGRSLSAWRSR